MISRTCLAALVATLMSSPAFAQEPVSLNPLRNVDKGSFSAFVEQPLFDPARRLPPPEAPVVVQAPVAVATPPEPPPNLRLVGLVHGRNDLAIVHLDQSENPTLLRNGAKLGAWTVVVQPLGLTLHDGDRNVSFTIFAKSNQPAPRNPDQ